MPSALLTHRPEFRLRRAQNWLFLGLMYGFFYMSRYNFAAVRSSIAEKFGWDYTASGSVMGAGLLTYGCAVFLNGPLADRIGGKRAILIGAAGAAIFNLLFGLCHLFLLRPAVMHDGVVLTPAEIGLGMNGATMIATCAALWACNNYFQSFGALSIVKINAAWFHISERGSFAGIFGIMIQGGRWLAFFVSPIILHYLPWQYVFWIPGGLLLIMGLLTWMRVENSPQEAGLDEFDTADESPEEPAGPASLGYVLRKVFARRAPWLIALSSMCIGFVRNSVDQWYATFVGGMFHQGLSSFAPYQFATSAIPFAAILGGLAAGNASDRIFGSRRAPVIFLAFLGQAVCLILLRCAVHDAWTSCLMLVIIAFFIQSAHSLVGGAASMDFGGRKAVATAAGLFDGAQYLAGAAVTVSMGHILDRYKTAAGGEWEVWPLVPLPFALIGAVLISRLWHTLPGRRGSRH